MTSSPHTNLALLSPRVQIFALRLREMVPAFLLRGGLQDILDLANWIAKEMKDVQLVKRGTHTKEKVRAKEDFGGR